MIENNELNKVEEQEAKRARRYFSNDELLQRYRVYMRRDDLSIHTYKTRETFVKEYFSFISSINKKTIYKLNGDTLSGYLDYLKRSNFTVHTQRLKLKSIRAFYNWLRQENIISQENNIFNNGFCIHSYIKELANSYTPDRVIKENSAIRSQMLGYIGKFTAYYINKGYCPSGVVIYQRELKRFINYLEQNTRIKAIGEISKNVLSEYQLYLNSTKKEDGGNYSASSRQKKLVVLRRFFKFLVQYDYMEKDPSAIIELPRLERGLPTCIMNDRELELLLNAPDTSTARGLRDRTIMEVLYSTGIRNNELCYLKLPDINFEDGLVRVEQAKGGIGFQRVVPIGKIACEFIRRYLKDARPYLLKGMQDEEYLFLNNLGGRLKRGTLIKYILAYRLKSNIRSKITAHSFRVTCATGMLKNHADVRYIQEQLGHRSLRSTQIYTRVFPYDLKKVHSRTHPREKILPIRQSRPAGAAQDSVVRQAHHGDERSRSIAPRAQENLLPQALVLNEALSLSKGEAEGLAPVVLQGISSTKSL